MDQQDRFDGDLLTIRSLAADDATAARAVVQALVPPGSSAAERSP
ncbi:MAG: hypothetical protein PGN25_10030 [Methylorubrum populi]